MILQALHRYYHILLEQDGSNVPKAGYSEATVNFEVHLDSEGEVVEIIPYTNDKGKLIKKHYNVPKQAKRASNIFPYFLCDKAEYMFGAAIGMRSACREALQALWKEVLENANDNELEEETTSLIKFIDNNQEKLTEQLQRLLSDELYQSLSNGGLCILKYAPTGGFFHDSPILQSMWERYLSMSRLSEKTSESTQMCLISGEKVPVSDIARLHPNIKNVIGAQSSGAALVSFNLASFNSFGREQSYNAPTSQKAADAYAYALNKLLDDPRHRIRMNDMTVVFWAESSSDHEQMFLASLLQEESIGDSVENELAPDIENVRERVKSAVNRVRNGQEFADTFEDLKTDTTFYILGLSPNAARLSVRFFFTGTLGEIGQRVWQHYKDLSIIGLERTPTVKQLLKELAVGHEWSNIPPNMEGQMLRSILLGLPYSRAVFAQLMNRIRADSDDIRKGLYKIGSVRAAMIKAYLLRANRNAMNMATEGELSVAENLQSTNVAYNLGRLFACLEKTQRDALGAGINATIRDRFWGAASASPSSVFPRLLHLVQHHVSKDDKWGNYNNELITKVMDTLPERLPRRLTLEEQGMFAIGYYHKRQSFYVSNDNSKSISDIE